MTVDDFLLYTFQGSISFMIGMLIGHAYRRWIRKRQDNEGKTDV